MEKEVLKDIDLNEKSIENINNNDKENEEKNNDSILMIPEINEIDEKEFEKEFSKPTIPIQSIEEQQKQHIESEEEIRKSNDKITKMELETENDKKQQQEQQENKEGYGNDDVTEMVLSSVLYVSQKALAGAQFVGNIFADIFGFGEGKYQYHIDEYNMIQEEKKRKLAEKALKESNMESQPESNQSNDINNVSISTESPKTLSQP
ncbi:hypothetical protein RB653_007727 [Dictyostelium firmibasis]|uniref:Uncharacterized protein n=1 Tax=Dictyostelium firmibasis TaxID=79012 RepID=A0AAN7TVW5_9MYCE